MANINTILKTL